MTFRILYSLLTFIDLIFFQRNNVDIYVSLISASIKKIENCAKYWMLTLHYMNFWSLIIIRFIHGVKTKRKGHSLRRSHTLYTMFPQSLPRTDDIFLIVSSDVDSQNFKNFRRFCRLFNFYFLFSHFLHEFTQVLHYLCIFFIIFLYTYFSKNIYHYFLRYEF